MLRSRGLFLVIAVAAIGACEANGYEVPPTAIGKDQVPVGPSRDYGAFVRPDHQPPPISGGTLLISRDGTRAYAADSDRDRVFIVDLVNEKVLHDVALQTDDEPGRVIEDGKGRVHVALRRGGAVVTIDPTTGAILERRAVCSMPRGLAWDEAADKIHVACATGELFTLPTVGAEKPRVLNLGDDLRDVIVKDGNLLISHFRHTDMLVVDRDGKEIAHPHLRPVSLAGGAVFDPAVTWRMRAFPTRNAVAMVHQRGGAAPVSTAPGGYGQQGGGCGSAIVHSAISIVTSTGEVLESPPIPRSVLPVDLAISDDESQVAIVNAGNWKSPEPTVQVFAMSVIVPPGGTTESPPPEKQFGECLKMIDVSAVLGNAIAVGFDRKNRVIVQTREPANIEIRGGGVTRTIRLSPVSVEDTGHTIFHLSAAVTGGVACASCHPEGGDDGRAWVFAGLGRRRTQTLRGGIMQTAPFHWAGDETDMNALMNDVFARRMQGGILSEGHITALSTWLDKVPAAPRMVPVDPVQLGTVNRGKALFHGEAECSTCHNGPLLTNHQTVNVGTGAAFQVPVLTGIRFRSPFMHDGCAATLLDRFDPVCGGGDAHGKTSKLSPTQLNELVAYLETL
jgi:hypothetical protein